MIEMLDVDKMPPQAGGKIKFMMIKSTFEH